MPVIYTAEGVKPLPSDMMYGLQRAAQTYKTGEDQYAEARARDLSERYRIAASANDADTRKQLIAGANALSDQYNEERGGVYDMYGMRHQNNIFAPGVSDPTGMALREQKMRQVQGFNNRAYNANRAADYARNLLARRRRGENISDQAMQDAQDSAEVWNSIVNAWKPKVDPVTGKPNDMGYDPGISKPDEQIWYDYLTKQWLNRNPQPVDRSRWLDTWGLTFTGKKPEYTPPF